MKEEGIEMSLVTYNILVGGFAKMENAESLNYDVKRKHKIPMARHGHFWSLASLPLPLPLPLPEKWKWKEVLKSGTPELARPRTRAICDPELGGSTGSAGERNRLVGSGQVKRLGWDVAAACGRRRGSTRAHAAYANVRLGYGEARRVYSSTRKGAGTTRVAEKGHRPGRPHAVMEARKCGSSFRVRAIETKRDRLMTACRQRRRGSGCTRRWRTDGWRCRSDERFDRERSAGWVGFRSVENGRLETAATGEAS
ncbi:pentatricopeptide repeat-containing protein [Cucumis melo var. makuwa]|uniref:Pentatricopeptide repeat-containing protein n=1 Tax=Cucumis melo var. makuwa TaxID=1194695 RepID=A0A5D3DXF3_CUCMM|nr:pentatricopeptide repeat-containing protein [Cucumis melo var. makuwa]